MTQHLFYPKTAMAHGLYELLNQLILKIDLDKPLDIYLAGGMAVHLYTQKRVTTDVDAEFGSRIFIPNDLSVDLSLEDGRQNVIYFDKNYNSTFALMHEDYREDSYLVDIALEKIRLHVLSPVDLAVSKIARLSEHDKEDIISLVALGLTNANEIEKRAKSALLGFVGGQTMLEFNIRDALELARYAEKQKKDIIEKTVKFSR